LEAQAKNIRSDGSRTIGSEAQAEDSNGRQPEGEAKAQAGEKPDGRAGRLIEGASWRSIERQPKKGRRRRESKILWTVAPEMRPRGVEG